ncbi:MAG: hypothetical protein PHQ41_06355 [Candidatus Cloacimonetes bacterium]|nr:hypothetical protein [Candidatus Cloacimonadota bacterium]
MSYLIDSNFWLELLLRQQHADEVHQFLQMVQLDEISLTEFTLYSKKNAGNDHGRKSRL